MRWAGVALKDEPEESITCRIWSMEVHPGFEPRAESKTGISVALKRLMSSKN